ncbi:MAG TPA: pyrroline-5-carboxylate reductase, partial [Campylobacterales bacterium]|nr:pyrroline-5-carboxylate reductase [Campylobacterales bacterium]
MKLTIVGTGKMAEAIIKGAVVYHDIEVLGRDEKKLEELQAKMPKINIVKLGDSFNIEGKNILLCVKPYALEPVSIKLQGEANALLSVLAGTTLMALEKNIKAKSYIRAMPNLAASHQKSMTTLFGDASFKQEAIEICES